MAKLRKKLVKNNGFWKINAIRPKTKIKLKRTRKYENESNAKLGGLVKELATPFYGNRLRYGRQEGITGNRYCGICS